MEKAEETKADGTCLAGEREDFSALNLYQKLARMSGEAHRIAPRGWNDHFKYNFVPHGDVVDMIRELCAKYGVVVLQRPVVESFHREPASEKQHLTRIIYEYEVINADAPEERFTLPAIGEGVDSLDKGSYKASTGADKYFWFRLLHIPTGDDPDATGTSSDGRARGKAAAAQRQLEPKARCERCHGPVTSLTIEKPGVPKEFIPAERVLARAQEKFGKPICAKCQILLEKTASSAAPGAQPQPAGETRAPSASAQSQSPPTTITRIPDSGGLCEIRGILKAFAPVEKNKKKWLSLTMADGVELTSWHLSEKSMAQFKSAVGKPCLIVCEEKAKGDSTYFNVSHFEEIDGKPLDSTVLANETVP